MDINKRTPGPGSKKMIAPDRALYYQRAADRAYFQQFQRFFLNLIARKDGLATFEYVADLDEVQQARLWRGLWSCNFPFGKKFYILFSPNKSLKCAAVIPPWDLEKTKRFVDWSIKENAGFKVDGNGK